MIFALIISAIAAAAVTLQIHGWSDLLTETNGSCGGRHGGACPQGAFLDTGLALIVAIFSVPMAFTMLFVARPRFVALFAVIGIIGGIFAGQSFYADIHGTNLSQDWSLPYDNPPTLVTEGAWLVGASVVRVRTDEVVSYAGATGAVQWTFPVPGQNVVCAVTRTTAGQVGVIGYAAEDAPCDQLTAIDLTTGRKLWSTTVDASDTSDQGDGLTDFVSAAGNTVAVRGDAGVTAYDARTGAQQWTQPAQDNCDDQFVVSDPDTVVAVAACQSGYVVADLDAATGTPRWQTPVDEPIADSSYELAVLSVNPVVIDDSIPGARGIDNIRIFDGQGRQNTTIEATNITTPDGPTSLDTSEYADPGFKPQPLIWTTVSGGTLVAMTKELNGHDDLVGYSTTTGRQKWLTALPDDVDALTTRGNQIVLLDNGQPSPLLMSVNISTGSLSTLGVLAGQTLDGEAAGLYLAGGKYVVVSQTGDTPGGPVFAFG